MKQTEEKSFFPMRIRSSLFFSRAFFQRQALILALLALVSLVSLFSGCRETRSPTSIDTCRDLLDQAAWDEAIRVCGTIQADEGRSLTAQARMGKAGISLLDLLDRLSNSTLSGVALILDAFVLQVGSAEFNVAEQAVNDFLTITDRSQADNFNLLITTDVLLNSLLTEHLNITVSARGELEVPGVTNSGLDTLTATSTDANRLAVLNNIYTTPDSYYTTTPLGWDTPGENTDLKRISTFVTTNKLAADALAITTDPALSSLSDLAFYTRIDNGACGYATGATVDPAEVAQAFPRRINTSHVDRLSRDLLYVYENLGSTTEWDGNFLLPSALLNPDFMGLDCTSVGGTSNPRLNAFSNCITVFPQGLQSTDIVAVTHPDLATNFDACGGDPTCTDFPVLTEYTPISADDSTPVSADAAIMQLSGILDDLYPIANAVTTASAIRGTHPAYACMEGDGLVHYREYDHYLRNLDQ